MQDAVHQEEQARLLIAYDNLHNLFSQALQEYEHVGLQREHLFMAMVLQATEEEQMLLNNVLATRDDLVEYYRQASEMVSTFEEQHLPLPPAPPAEEVETLVAADEYETEHRSHHRNLL